MNNVGGKIIVIFILAFAGGFLFSIFFDTAVITPDAIQYDLIAYNVAADNGFSLDKKVPYEPTMAREPGYPFFLAFVYKTFGYNRHAALVFQCILHGISAILTFALGNMLFNRAIGFIAGILTAINFTLANFCAYLLTETFFTFLLLGAILCFYFYLKHKRAVSAAAGSFLVGLCILTKAGSLFLIFFILAAILISEVLKKEFRPLRFFIIFLLSLVIVIGTILPWSMRNKKEFGAYSLTYRIGVHLYSRAAKLKDNAKTVFITSVYNFSEFLGNKFFPDAAENANEYLYMGLREGEQERTRYIKEGFSPNEADKKVFNEAVENIKMHPVKYILYTPVEAIKLLSFSYVPVLNEDFAIERFDSTQKGMLFLSGIRAFFKVFGLLLFGLSIACLFRYRKSAYGLLLITATVAYFALVYSLSDAYARYFVVFIPFFTLMAAASIWKTQEKR